MAKLNEVPPPAPETIDSLKRKYTRQNREIVRTNTAQSARIRNLECEITRLLNENLALREEAISARADADKWKSAHKLTKEILRMKEQLESKLSEVHELVGELGTLPEKVARRSSQRRRRDGFVSEILVPPEEREPRHRQTLLEQEGRLPAILEDKYYPRRTIEAQDTTNIKLEELGDDLESPEIGPPPVAHFDDPEAVIFNTAKSPRRTSTELLDECDRTAKTTTGLIESRRKRRTSTLIVDSALDDSLQAASTVIPPSIESQAQSEPETAKPQPQSILKKGAKRKLEVSELEDTSNTSKDLDDFIFQRKSTTPVPSLNRPSRFSRPVARPNEDLSSTKRDASPGRDASRKALALKTTNSPAKRRMVSNDKSTASDTEKEKSRSEKRIVSRVRARPNMVAGTTVSTSQKPIIADKDERDQRSKTPAAELEDILSPMPSEPSLKPRPSKEAALTNSVEDVLNGSIGRGSRRARAAVSYAEPNLRDKMRRPGKELVGAVDGLIKTSNESEAHRSRGEAVEITARSSNQRTSMDTQPKDPGNHVPVNSEPPSPSKADRARTSRTSKSCEQSATSEAASASVFDPPTSSPITQLEPDIRETTRLQQQSQVLKSRRYSAQPSSAASRDSTLAAPTKHRTTISTSELRRQNREMLSDSEERKHGRTPSDSGSDVRALPRGGLSRRRSLMV